MYFIKILFVLIFITSIGESCLQVDQVPKNSNDPRLLAPWVATIFKRNESGKWEYHCGGTITSQHVIITSAHCVTKRQGSPRFETINHLKYTDLRVLVGLLTNDYYSNRDENVQEMEVAMIREHKTPSAVSDSGYELIYNRPSNLAGVLLKTVFNFTSYVQPVCLVEVPNSIDETITLIPGEVGIVGGFDINNSGGGNSKLQKLQIYKIKIVDTRTCVKSYGDQPFNVVCGHLSGGNNNKESILPCFLEGAGLIVSTDGNNTGVGSLYLMGIYTSNTSTKKYMYPYPIHETNTSTNCNNKDLAFFTKHGEFYRWAIGHSFCGIGLLECQSQNCRPLNELCDGIAQCHDKTDESIEVCENQNICKINEQFRCKYGACIDISKICNGKMDCADNSDEELDKCQKKLDVGVGSSNNKTS